MELVVGVLLVPALIAVTARFLVRGVDGSVRLPRIVDDSIGMYVLRGITGRPLGRMPDSVPSVDPFARYRRPSTVLAPRVDPGIRLARWPVQTTVAAGGPSLVVAASSDPGWWAVPRLDVGGGAFDTTSFPTLAREPLLARLRPALRPSWLATAVVGGFLAGAWLALITR